MKSTASASWSAIGTRSSPPRSTPCRCGRCGDGQDSAAGAEGERVRRAVGAHHVLSIAGYRDAGEDPGALLRRPQQQLDVDAAAHGILIEPSAFFLRFWGNWKPTGTRASTVSDGLMYERSRGSHDSDRFFTLRSSLRNTVIDI